MLKGKRIYHWEHTAKLCQATLWPHLTEDARRRAGGRLDILPRDLQGKRGSGGMTGADVRAMRGMFKHVETVAAENIRVASVG